MAQVDSETISHGESALACDTQTLDRTDPRPAAPLDALINC
jgi:hypothetical protein